MTSTVSSAEPLVQGAFFKPCELSAPFNWQPGLLRKLDELRCMGQFCDVTIQVDDTIGDASFLPYMRVHSVIVAAGSPMLHEKLQDPSFAGSVLVAGVGVWQWEQVINFLYTGKVCLTASGQAEALVQAAIELKMEVLVNMLQDHLGPSDAAAVEDVKPLKSRQAADTSEPMDDDDEDNDADAGPLYGDEDTMYHHQLEVLQPDNAHRRKRERKIRKPKRFLPEPEHVSTHRGRGRPRKSNVTKKKAGRIKTALGEQWPQTMSHEDNDENLEKTDEIKQEPYEEDQDIKQEPDEETQTADERDQDTEEIKQEPDEEDQDTEETQTADEENQDTEETQTGDEEDQDTSYDNGVDDSDEDFEIDSEVDDEESDDSSAEDYPAPKKRKTTAEDISKKDFPAPKKRNKTADDISAEDYPAPKKRKTTAEDISKKDFPAPKKRNKTADDISGEDIPAPKKRKKTADDSSEDFPTHKKTRKTAEDIAKYEELRKQFITSEGELIEMTFPHYACKICNDTFIRRPELRKHIVTSHGEDKISEAMAPKRQHLREHCPKCDVTMEFDILRKHMWKHHQLRVKVIDHLGRRSENRTYYKCQSCGFLETHFSMMKDHWDTVHKGLKVQCEVCGLCLSAKRHLHLHMRTHTDERPYKCPHCPKSFRKHHALVNHEPLHTGYKPYTCKLCGKQFVQVTSIDLHFRNHHPTVPKEERKQNRTYQALSKASVDCMVVKPVPDRKSKRKDGGIKGTEGKKSVTANPLIASVPYDEQMNDAQLQQCEYQGNSSFFPLLYDDMLYPKQ